MQPRFLILGASGLIGRCALAALGPERAIGTYFLHPFPGGHRFDMASDRIEDLLDGRHGRFSHALILGASAAIDACARDPAGTARLNVAGAIAACTGAMACGVVPIFASSDAVYDGSRAMWREEDEARPVLTYGRQKLAVEQALRAQDKSWIALRIAKVLDPELGSDGILGPWVRALAGGELIRCATDQRFSPIGVPAVVEAIEKLAATGATGLFNLGGAEAVTRHELLNLFLAAIRPKLHAEPRVEVCHLNDISFVERRPLDASLSIERLTRAIGSVGTSLAALCAEAGARMGP
jgi:dTDP-4-dehydrorhamnose reductase